MEPKTIREQVVARAAELNMTAYAIAAALKSDGDWTVSPNHVKAFMDGRKDMTSQRLDQVFKILGLQVKRR